MTDVNVESGTTLTMVSGSNDGSNLSPTSIQAGRSVYFQLEGNVIYQPAAT
jgi:hypothetical protein